MDLSVQEGQHVPGHLRAKNNSFIFSSVRSQFFRLKGGAGANPSGHWVRGMTLDMCVLSEILLFNACLTLSLIVQEEEIAVIQ